MSPCMGLQSQHGPSVPTLHITARVQEPPACAGGLLLGGKMGLDERWDGSLPGAPAVRLVDGAQLLFPRAPLPSCWHQGICGGGGSPQEPSQR